MEMDPETLPLFSHSGASSNSTIYFPNYFLEENDATMRLIQDLFALLSAATGSNAVVDVTNIPQFQNELRYLFCHNTQFFLEDDLRNGVNRLNQHFMARDREIQRRGNAFVRVQMAAAEMILYGECRCAESADVERDQQLIFEVAAPQSRSDSISLSDITPSIVTPQPTTSAHADVQTLQPSLTPPTSPKRTRSRSGSAPNTPNTPEPVVARQPLGMFRSESTKPDHLKASPKCVFQLDEQTNAMVAKFLEAEFQGSDTLDPNTLSEADSHRLSELWEYFDVSCEYEPLTKDDIAVGLTKWGANFIANDSICQLLGNYYCQKKLKHAINAFYGSIVKLRQQTASAAVTDHSISNNDTDCSIPVGSTVIYTDDTGLNHFGVVNSKALVTKQGTLAEYANRHQAQWVYEVDIMGMGLRRAYGRSLMAIADDSEDPTLSPTNETLSPTQPAPESSGDSCTSAITDPERRDRGLSFNLPTQQRVRSDSGYGTVDSPSLPTYGSPSSARSRSGSLGSPSLMRRASRSNSMGQYNIQSSVINNYLNSLQQQQPAQPNASQTPITPATDEADAGDSVVSSRSGYASSKDNSSDYATVLQAGKIKEQLDSQESVDFVNQFRSKLAKPTASSAATTAVPSTFPNLASGNIPIPATGLSVEQLNRILHSDNSAELVEEFDKKYADTKQYHTDRYNNYIAKYHSEPREPRDPWPRQRPQQLANNEDDDGDVDSVGCVADNSEHTPVDDWENFENKWQFSSLLAENSDRMDIQDISKDPTVAAYNGQDLDEMDEDQLMRYLREQGILYDDNNESANKKDSTAAAIATTSDVENKALDTEDIKNLCKKDIQSSGSHPVMVNNFTRDDSAAKDSDEPDELDASVENILKIKPSDVDKAIEKATTTTRRFVPKVNPDVVCGKPMTQSERAVLRALSTYLGEEFRMSDEILEDIEPQYEQPEYFLWFRVG
jgi:hypothetical protein